MFQFLNLLFKQILYSILNFQILFVTTLEGAFSAVSKPNFASKYAFESSRRDLQNALLCTALKSYFLPSDLFPRIHCFKPPHLNSPSSHPARISSKNDEIPLPKNQEKCLQENSAQLKSAYVRASSARVRNSAFFSAVGKARASAPCAFIPSLHVQIDGFPYYQLVIVY